jgi:uncharacterized protein
MAELTQEDVVLAALSSGQGMTFSPVKVQKLLFLVDKNIPSYTDGPHFDFRAYDYGPFDADVYRVLEALEEKGLVEVNKSPFTRWRDYRLTPEGQKRGDTVLSGMATEAKQFLEALVAWMRKLSFEQLVSAIYKQYPDMKANSVFRGAQ